MSGNKSLVYTNAYRQITGKERTDILSSALDYAAATSTYRPPAVLTNTALTSSNYTAVKRGQLLAGSSKPGPYRYQTVIIKNLQDYGTRSTQPLV